MKYLIYYSLLFTIAFFLAAGCAEQKDGLTQPEEVSVHGTGSLIESSSNFHGYYLTESSLSDCQDCHAADFTGGTAGISCVNCHSSIEVHSSTDTWHADYIEANNIFYECTDCHGDGFTGGISSPTCTTCHSGIDVHKDGIILASSDNFHGNYIRNNNWDLTLCSSCHGDDYSGGSIAATSCLTCHTEAAGPEACNTCHGDFDNIRQIAPPQGTSNETETSSAAVGAHQVHLKDSDLREKTLCYECHKVPVTFDAEGHIDDTERSELIFGTFANSGPDEASYNFDELTCRNTYCHGNFEFAKSESSYPSLYTSDKITGNNYSPIWNVVGGTQAQCGTCHGEISSDGELVTPLPTGHYGDFTLEKCSLCHSGVVDGNGNIIDISKHMNGEINVYGN